MFSRIQKAKEENEGGFTLIELLVVVVIIGILAAIAIPTFLSQREKAWEKAAHSDLRNGAVIMEEYFSENATYAGTTGFKESTDVIVTEVGSDANQYCIQAVHGLLPVGEETFKIDSADGVVADGAC